MKNYKVRSKKIYVIAGIVIALEMIILRLASEFFASPESLLGRLIGIILCMIPIEWLLFLLKTDSRISPKKRLICTFFFYFIIVVIILATIAELTMK